MKIRVKNNRLALEAKVTNLSDIKEDRLHEIARKYQIGTQRLVAVPTQRMQGGRVVEDTEQAMETKPRQLIEDEIRRRLTITLDVPKEYWTEAQQAAFFDNDIPNEKDINKEVQVKTDARIIQVLPPYEDTKDTIKQARLLAELTPEQWDFFKGAYNYILKIEEKPDGTKTKKNVYVHRLMEFDKIPENDEDKAIVEEEEVKKAEKDGKKSKAK